MSRRVRDVIATVVTFLLAATKWKQSYGFYGWHSVYGWLALLPAFVVAIMFSLVGGWTWSRKGRSASQGYFIGLLVFFVVGKFLATWTVACFVAAIPTMVISLFLKPNTDVLERRALNSGMKRCPACAELVRREATKCRFCGEALSIEAPTPHSHAPSQQDAPVDSQLAQLRNRVEPITARLVAWSRPRFARGLDAAREHVLPQLKSVWARHRAVMLVLGALVIASASWLMLRTTTKINTESQCREAFIQYLILGGGSRAPATRDADFVLKIYRCGSSGTYKAEQTLRSIASGGAAPDSRETPLQLDLRRQMEEFFLAHYPDGEEQVSAPSPGTSNADTGAPTSTHDGGSELRRELASMWAFTASSRIASMALAVAALVALIAVVLVAVRRHVLDQAPLRVLSRMRAFLVRQRYVILAASVVALVAGTAVVLMQIVSRASSRSSARATVIETADMMQPTNVTNGAPTTDASSCDMTGRWNLIFKWRSKRCRDAYNDAERSQTVIINKGSDGKHRSKSGTFLDVTRDPSGRCKIDFARVSEDSYENFVLVEDGSGVTGSANYGDVSKCEREASITATRTALKASDVAFSEEEEEEYAKAFIEALYSRCSGLPFLQGERGRRFEWELLISADDAPQRFVVDGKDQHIKEQCAAVVDHPEDWAPAINISGGVVVLRGSSSIAEKPLLLPLPQQPPPPSPSTSVPPSPPPSQAPPATVIQPSHEHAAQPAPPASAATPPSPAPSPPPSPSPASASPAPSPTPAPPNGWADPFHAP